MNVSDERLAEMAEFIVAFPGFTPETYWALTVREQQALITAYNKANKQ